jgi:hypothetical protein
MDTPACQQRFPTGHQGRSDGLTVSCESPFVDAHASNPPAEGVVGQKLQLPTPRMLAAAN